MSNPIPSRAPSPAWRLERVRASSSKMHLGTTRSTSRSLFPKYGRRSGPSSSYRCGLLTVRRACSVWVGPDDAVRAEGYRLTQPERFAAQAGLACGSSGRRTTKPARRGRRSGPDRPRPGRPGHRAVVRRRSGPGERSPTGSGRRSRDERVVRPSMTSTRRSRTSVARSSLSVRHRVRPRRPQRHPRDGTARDVALGFSRRCGMEGPWTTASARGPCSSPGGPR